MTDKERELFRTILFTSHESIENFIDVLIATYFIDGYDKGILHGRAIKLRRDLIQVLNCNQIYNWVINNHGKFQWQKSFREFLNTLYKI